MGTAAQTAWSQISINIKMAVGARKAKVTSENKLTFQVERRPYRYIEVTYHEGADVYSVEYFRLKRGSFEKVQIEEAEAPIYCDQLSEVVYRMVNK